jgi:hypothetical protein
MPKRERSAALAGAIMLTIILPIAIDQGYFRYNPYALPILTLFATLLYLGFFFTSNFCKKLVHRIYLRSPKLSIIGFTIVGIIVFSILGIGEWWGLQKSISHVSKLRVEDNPKPEQPKTPPKMAEIIPPPTKKIKPIASNKEISQPSFQIENESRPSVYPKSEKNNIFPENGKWSYRRFSYDAVLHNVGTRVLNVSGVHLCALMPNEKGCPRSFGLASEFLLEPGGKWHLAFDTSQQSVAELIAELDNVELFLQIEYINPDRSVSAYRRWIGGFRGEVTVMHMDIKIPKQD